MKDSQKSKIRKERREKNMKKRLLAFLVTVFTLICMALPAYAEEGAGTPPSPRRLDVQLVQVSLRDSGNTVHTIQTSVSTENVVTVKDQPITRGIKVSKTWVGNTGTQAVMHLYADNVDTGKSVTLDTSNNWEYTFTGLRKYNGTQEIQYSIKEDEMNFYMTSIAGDMENGFNVTNTWNEQHEVPGDAPTVEIPEFKITTFVNTDNEPIADFETGFTEKKDEITFNGTKYVFKEKLPDLDGIRTYVYEKFESEIPNDAPEVTLPELKVTRFVDEQGNDIHELAENFVEKKEISGYVFKETTETSDIRTHVYTKVETEIPNDSPTVEVPELKITRFVDTNGVELKNIVEGFVEKDTNIIYENEQYNYVNTTEKDGIRTHIYKKHVNEEVPGNNTTTPTNNTTTENKVVSDHIVPTGDNVNNTLKLFALSMLGLGFTLLYKKKTTEYSLSKVRKLICALLCVATLAGCGIAKKSPQYIAELRLPYVGPTDHKKLEVSYRFQNTDVRVGEFPSIGHLVLKVYNENDEMLGYEIVNAYDVYRFLKEDDYDMIFGVATINLDTEVKQGDKLRVVGEVKVHYREDESKDVTLTDEAECIVD